MAEGHPADETYPRPSRLSYSPLTAGPSTGANDHRDRSRGRRAVPAATLFRRADDSGVSRIGPALLRGSQVHTGCATFGAFGEGLRRLTGDRSETRGHRRSLRETRTPRGAPEVDHLHINNRRSASGVPPFGYPSGPGRSRSATRAATLPPDPSGRASSAEAFARLLLSPHRIDAPPSDAAGSNALLALMHAPLPS